MRGRRILAVAGSLTLALGGAGAWLVTHRSAEAASSPDRTTATVERGSLSSGLTLTGQLGYGTPTVVPAPQDGVVTALPTPGQVIGTGEVLYALNGRPVLVLRGDTPLWRDLGLGDSGTDVLAVRSALGELGYDIGDPATDTYDPKLASAVGAFYRDRGYPEPTALPGAEADREQADQRLRTARADLVSAQAALAAKQAGPTAGDRAEAEAAVSAARRSLAEAEARAASEATAAPDAGEEGTGAAAAADGPSVAAATETLRTAEARLADLDAPQDSSTETAAVTVAAAAKDTAARAAARAGSNGLRAAEVVLVPTASVRVDSVSAVLGQTGGDKVLSWTGVDLRGYATLTPAQSRQIATGTALRVTLPGGGAEVDGIVAAVEPTGKSSDGTATDPRLVVDLPDQEALSGAGLATVTITLPSEEVADALVVPVTALLALAEGGYALEVVDPADPSSTTLVPVEVGLVTEARAQVVTDQVDEGATVVIP